MSKLGGLIALSSALLWVAGVSAHNALLSSMAAAPGIDFVFMPSGVRLILLMLGGVWAAVGVSVGSLFLVGREFTTADSGVIVLISLCTGFCPYLALLATQRLFGISRDLGNLTALHLPLIALGVAVGSSLLHNLLFTGLGLQQLAQLPPHLLAMAAGDFTGSLLAVAILFAAVRLRRMVRG